MKIIPLKICLIWNRLTFVKISEGLKSSNIRATHNQFTKMFWCSSYSERSSWWWEFPQSILTHHSRRKQEERTWNSRIVTSLVCDLTRRQTAQSSWAVMISQRKFSSDVHETFNHWVNLTAQLWLSLAKPYSAQLWSWAVNCISYVCISIKNFLFIFLWKKWNSCVNFSNVLLSTFRLKFFLFLLSHLIRIPFA